jgi:hypothetical protein
MLGSSSGGILGCKEHRPNPRITQITTDELLATISLPAGFYAVNTGSQDDYGPYQTGGTAGSPTSGPWQDAGQNGTLSTDDLMDTAQWQTGVFGQPASRVPAVTIDMLTQPPAEFSIAAFYRQVELTAAVQLDGLPGQAPAGPTAGVLIVEGIQETFGLGIRQVQLNTAPAAQSNAWILGDPVLGVLGTTTVPGRSSTPPGGYGPPYAPVATFSTTMNRTGAVGAQDLRTLTDPVARRLQPAFGFAFQSVAGAGPGLVTFDSIVSDTAGGFGGFGSSDNVYTVAEDWPGDYLVMAVVQFHSGQSLTGVGAKFTVALAGGGPTVWYPAWTGYRSAGTQYTAVAIAGVIGPCLPGDTISVTASTGTLGIADGGSQLAVIWQGRGTGVAPTLAARGRPVGPARPPRFRKGRTYG